MALREKEMEIQSKITESKFQMKTGKFDVSKHIRLVSPFHEEEVEKYFLYFEKIVDSLKWPDDVWTLHLQSVLIGKARGIYTALQVW